MEHLKKDVKTYLLVGIFATVLFWPPLGLAAVIFAERAKMYIALDNPAKALLSAGKAKFWSAAAVFVGAVTYLAAGLSMLF